MKEYLPYLVSILTAVLSAIVSITVCKKQTKTEIDKIKEQSKANIELEREKLQLEKEKIELEHKLELEKIHTQNDDAFASGITDKLLDMAFQNPDVQKQFADGIKKEPTPLGVSPFFHGIRQRPTLPGRLQPSTIGAERLNFCVRYGNRWIPFAIVTGKL